MLFEVRGLLQNALMASRSVRNLASRFHSTGMNGDPHRAREAFEWYADAVDVRGKDILELGPGQTPEVLLLASAAGARRCIGLETQSYREHTTVRHSKAVRILLYGGRRFPLENGSVDVVWCSDVFEHLRHPEITVEEIVRVLRPGGMLAVRVDLRDHYFLLDENRWLECLKYPEPLWRALTWYRSSYVNRLRYSEWQALFLRHGLQPRTVTARRSETLQRLYEAGSIRIAGRSLTRDDALIYRFDAVLTKSP